MPDTLQGRFEMIALHLALVLRRLSRRGPRRAAMGVALTEAFVVDMDDAMREMTFGDLAVPREVKRAAAALFDRHRAYLAALAAAADMSLGRRWRPSSAISLPADGLDARRLSDYVRRCASALDAQPAAHILAGRIDWPDPAAPEPRG